MKIKLFLDTNIMLDLLGERSPFYTSVARIATKAEKGEFQLVVSALSFVTVEYYLSKYDNIENVKNKLRGFKIISEICDLDEKVVEKALNSTFADFEDSIQYYSALKSDCKIIITRNVKDFKQSEIPVMTAEEYLSSIL